jgi:hypothetical protein
VKRLFRGGVTEGTRTPDLRDHNPNLLSALSQLREPKGPRPVIPQNCGRPLVSADARRRPLWHGPSADRAQQSLRSLTATPSRRRGHGIYCEPSVRDNWPAERAAGLAGDDF